MLQRMIRALKLDATVFEEVEHDETATGQALAVVLIAALLGSIWGLLQGGLLGILGMLLIALIGWVAWSVLIYFIGTTLFGGTATLGEVLRALGFAYTPMSLAIVPYLGWVVGFVMTTINFVLATRQSLDTTTGKAVGIVLVSSLGYIVIAVVMIVFRVLLGGAG